MIFTTVEN